MSNYQKPFTTLTERITNAQRARERRRRTLTNCPVCGEELRVECYHAIEQHYKDKHAAGRDGDPPPTAQNLAEQIDEIWKSIRRRPPSPRADLIPPSDPIPSVTPYSVDPDPSTPIPEPERQLTPNHPPFSETTHKNKDERTIALKGRRARHTPARSTDNDFQRGLTKQWGKLWTPIDDSPLSQCADAKRSGDGSESFQAPASVRSFEHRSSEPDNTEIMIKQPETRPISQEQLVAEVKGIYAGLVMVESKCIEVDDSQSSNKDTNPKLNNEQWQGLIALHRTLLHEHHDFFLASQHPSASPELRRLASKYAMPAKLQEISAPLVHAHDVSFSGKGNGPLVARGHIDGWEVNALADTGAGYNIVPAVVAKRLGWDPASFHGHEHGRGEKLRMANGRFINTIGAFEAVWKFASDPRKSWKITFHVVRNLVHEAVLGKGFLMGSETMTKHRHRLSRLKRAIRTLHGLPMLSVNNIGAVAQRLQGMIVGDHVEALPDSGSEPNLLAFDYVTRRGFRKLVNTNDIRMIQFADGTVQKTMGSVWLNWAYASSSGDDDDDEWSEHFVEFHVLDGCAYDVILGQDVLEDTDAFITHEGSFVDLNTDSEPSGLNLVTWASKDHHRQGLPPGAGGTFSRDWLRVGRQRLSLSPPLATDDSTQTPSPFLPDRLPGPDPAMRPAPPGLTSADLRHHRREELERRAEAERKYRRIPRGPEREAAVAQEEECQRRYDMAHLLPPISDVSSESGSGLVTSSSVVGAKFVHGSADPNCAAPTRESLRKKLGRLRGVFPGGSKRSRLQTGSMVAVQSGVIN